MQYGRKAYGPQRRVSTATLARDIVASIREHASHGVTRTVEQYTPCPETQQMVLALIHQAA